MKNLLKINFITLSSIFLLGLSLSGIFLPSLTLAVTPASPDSATDTTTATEAPITPEELFYQFTYKDAKSMSGTNIGAVNAIASTASWQQVLTSIIKILLNISGGLALIALTFGGATMVLARGVPDAFGKAKKIVTFAIIGLVVISISYALVIGVSNLQFFPSISSGNGPSTPAPAQPAAGLGNNANLNQAGQ